MTESAQRSAGEHEGEWGALTVPGALSATGGGVGIRLMAGVPPVSEQEAIPGAAQPGREDLLASAFLHLPEEERRVLILRLFHGLPCETIGRQVGQSAAMVRRTQNRALTRLRALVDCEAEAS